MAKFKVGDIIVGPKGGVRKVLSISKIFNVEKYFLEVIKSKTKIIGIAYTYDAIATDNSFTLSPGVPITPAQTPAGNKPKFQVGDIIVAHTDKREIQYVGGLDYRLKITAGLNQNIGFVYYEEIDLIDAVYKLDTPAPKQTPIMPKFHTGDTVISQGEVYKIIHIDIGSFDYRMEIIHSIVLKPGSQHTFKWIDIDPGFRFLSATNNTKPASLNSAAAIHLGKYIQGTVGTQFGTIGAPFKKTDELKCECGLGLNKFSHRHYNWCKLYKGE